MKRYGKLISMLVIATLLITSLGILPSSAATSSTYTVQSGDTLWKISNNIGVAVNDLKLLNGLKTDDIWVGEVLKAQLDTHLYIVKSGDSLWTIASKYGMSINSLKALNGLTSDSIYIGQALRTMPDTLSYVVISGDSLFLIASKFSITVSDIKSINALTGDSINVGQKLLIPYKLQGGTTPTPSHPTPVKYWPSITYIVQAGDNATSIGRKFGIVASDIMKYNYMTDADWFNEGEKIAINGYAPRNYDVVPNEDGAPTKYGHLVDWFLDGQYLLRRNSVLRICDLYSGKSFYVKVMGGYNHADVEPLTTSDTNIMKQLWPSWDWTPRPVVIYKDGMNIAASLSGMPHSFDTITNNGVTGHFDCYLLNSIPHGLETSQAYVSQHYSNVYKSAGITK